MNGGTPAARRLPDPVLAGLAFFYIAWSAYFVSLYFDSPLLKIDDGSQYLLLARSLALGRGFSNLAMPGVPDFLDLPSAFPLMLAPSWLLPGFPWFALHLALALAACLGAWLSFLWLRRFLPRSQAFLIALAFACGPNFVIMANSVMTEAPCVLLLFAALWLTARDADAGGKSLEGWLALIGWLVLFRLRINTMPFLVLHLWVLARRGERTRWMTGALLALLWLAFERTLKLPDSGGYLQYDLGNRLPAQGGTLGTLLALAKAAAGNFYSFCGSAFANLMLPRLYHLAPMDPFKRAAVLGLFAWALWGLALFWRRHPATRPYLAAFFLSWAPIFLQRPLGLQRYFLPSFPLLAAFLVLPFHALEARFRAPAWRFLAPACLAVLVASHALQTVMVGDFDYDREKRLAYEYLHQVIRAAPSRPDLVVSNHHYLTHLVTGLPTLVHPNQWAHARSSGLLESRQRIWAIIPFAPAEAGKVDFGPGYGRVEPALADTGHFSLFELRPVPATPTGRK